MRLSESSAERPLASKARIKNACVLLGSRSAGLSSYDFGVLLGTNFKILRNIILQVFFLHALHSLTSVMV